MSERAILGRHLRTHGGQLAGAYAFALGSVGAGLMVPWILQLLIDHVLPGEPLPGALGGLTAGWSPAELVGVLSAGAVVIAAAEAWMTEQQRTRTARVREGLTRGMRLDVLRHLFTLPPFTGTQDRSGELLTRLIADVTLVARLFTKTVPMLIRFAATALAMLVVVVWIAPHVAVLLAVALVPLGMVARMHGRQLTEAMRRKRSGEGEVAGLAQEIIAGRTTVQAQGRAPAVSTRFDEVNSRSAGVGVEAARTAARMERALKIGQGATVGLLMGVGGVLVLYGRVTVGELTVILAYVSQLLKPIERINDLSTAVASGIAAGERLTQLMALVPAVTELPTAVSMPSAEGALTIERVSFRYPNSGGAPLALQDIDMIVRPRALTVVVGRSGSGKSTLLNLLVRIFDPDRGRILLDGVPLRQLRLEDVRRHIFVVRQHLHLFGGTWREHLCDGEDLPDEALWEALSNVALNKRVRASSRQLDTPLSENAADLSGGERQRIGIARALLRPCSVLLLDEPLAHVDVMSEAIIIEAIAELSTRSTCLATTHRDSLLRRADQVYRLEGGRVIPPVEGSGLRTLSVAGR